ncbi:hypothetical protein KUM42_08270 [Modestobacter sp. L9-4]|uniref:hypothetical protein n=1 Tax=Modestobacter sp. L9-4 TaxID=2851567 RepID=UPI001C73FA6A|nr:hypothetical protein [Modestobacter sp. L9-4]QXG77485.1 hypothetical protein KUM42_08270 [Modestobacter sp. L9-4]
MLSRDGLDGGAEARGRALIDQGLLLLGDALKVRLEPHLEAEFGSEWSTQVRAKRGRFARRDMASYAQCIVGDGDLRETRPTFRAALGVPMTANVDRALRAAVRVRNRFAHPDEPADVRDVQSDIGHLLFLARTLQLDCRDRLQAVAREAEALSAAGSSGAQLSTRAMQDLQEQADRAVAEAARLREQLASADAARERTHDELMRTEDALKAAVTAQDDLAARAEALRTQLRTAAANSTLTDELQQQLAVAEKQAADQAKRLAESEMQRAALQEQLEAHNRTITEAQRQSGEAETDRENLAGTVAFGEALTDPDQESLADLLEQLRSLLADLTDTQGGAGADSPAGEVTVPPPGKEWPYPRGEDVWTLSRARRSLVTYDGRLSLDELWPRPEVERLVDAFLQIRPEGGRVWIDDDGDATTYVDGVLTYLGPVVRDAEDTQFNDPPIGTPHPPGGNRYSVTRAGIQRHPDGAWLASQIDAGCAEEVRKRLRAVRRSGGRYRVDSTGAATTCVDGEWVFAGRVRAAEWFPAT